MWVEELKTGKLRAVERYTDPLTEKRKKVSITIPDRKRKTLKEAEKALEQKIKDALEVKSDRLRLGELAELYLADCEKMLKLSTMSKKSSIARKITMDIGRDVYVDRITAKHITSSLTSAGAVKEIKAMLKWAYINDYIDDISFLIKVRSPECVHRDGKKYLESNELKDLLSRIQRDDYRDLTEFLALTGMRIGEALAITIDDIDTKERLISVNKTFYGKTMVLNDSPKTESSRREIYIQDDLLPLVKKLYRSTREKSMFTQCKYIFQNNGKAINYNTYSKVLRRHGIYPHLLRHTHTALLAEQGVPLDVISRRLGHEDSDITREIYYHVTEKQKEKDHEAVRRVSIF